MNKTCFQLGFFKARTVIFCANIPLEAQIFNIQLIETNEGTTIED